MGFEAAGAALADFVATDAAVAGAGALGTDLLGATVAEGAVGAGLTDAAVAGGAGFGAGAAGGALGTDLLGQTVGEGAVGAGLTDAQVAGGASFGGAAPSLSSTLGTDLTGASVAPGATSGGASGVPAWDAAPGASGSGVGVTAPGATAPVSPTGAGPGATPDVPGVNPDTLPVPSGSAPPTGMPTSAPPYAGPGTPGAGAAGEGLSTVDKAIEAVKAGGSSAWDAYKTGAPAINAGLTGLSAVRQMQGAGSAQKQLNSIAGPAQAASADLLGKFKSGQINGADAFAIQQWQQQQTSQMDQYYAKAGLSNSSMHVEAKGKIAQQAESMRQQAVQNLLDGGLKAAGISNPTLVAGVNAGMKEDQQSQQAMQSFIGQLAKMNTPQASTPAAPATAPTGVPG